MEVGGGFEHAGDAQEFDVLESRTQELEADGELFAIGAGKAVREADARNAGEVCVDGVDVLHVHLQRVVGFCAELESRARGRGTKDGITGGESGVEIAFDQTADFKGGEVILVAVTGGEGVGAEHDAAFDLGAEAFGAAARVDVDEVLGLVGPVAVADTVEPGEV